MNDQLKQIVAPLLEWYRRCARELSWRSDPTPYRVWVSEIMLQQTRVEAVKPYYERFMEQLPTVQALAEAEEEKLLKLWEGLGYYSRVRNLQKAAKVVMKIYGGELPADFETLRSLPGIGEYTAGAIASIAFGKPVPAVDGNVLRVLSRVTESRRDILNSKVKKEFSEQLREIYPTDCAGDFTQALMELGAMVCVPNGVPLCEQCPLSHCCQAFLHQTMLELPVKAEKKPRKLKEKTVFVALDPQNRIAVQKRPDTGLLAGLWEFPNAEGALTREQAAEYWKNLGVCPGSIQKLRAAKHIFTHVEWKMSGYLVRLPQSVDQFVWVTKEELHGQYAVPNAYKAFLKVLAEVLG